MSDLYKVDRRVERTRNAIISAFKEMIIEKDYKDITIKDLASKANINRKTFYLHYNSMEDILFDLALEISELLFEMLESNGFFTSGSFDINILIDCIDKLLNTNYELTKRIISANSYRFFARNIKDLVKDSFVRKVKNSWWKLKSNLSRPSKNHNKRKNFKYHKGGKTWNIKLVLTMMITLPIHQ